MIDTTRREFCQQTLGSLLTYSLLETLIGGDVLADEVKPVTARWLAELDQLGRDVRGQKLKQVDWQKKVEELLAKVDVPDLLKLIDFAKLEKSVKFRDRGESSLRPKFPRVEGLPTDLVFGHQVFALGNGRSVVPHGHDNMATAFLILKGKFEGKHYDRLADEGKFMIIRPTLDRQFGVGEVSTVSDHKDNVHWFKAASDEGGFIFNIHVMNVAPTSGRGAARIYIDPAGEKLSGGRIKARRISRDEATKLYG
jgi:hypothetical protein